MEYMQRIKKKSLGEPNQPLLIAKIPPKNEDEAEASSKGGKGGKGKGKPSGGSSDSSRNKTPTWLVPEFMEFSLGEKRKKDLTSMERSGTLARVFTFANFSDQI